MKEQAKAWFPVSDIDSAFGSISFSYNGGQSLLLTLHGERTLTIDYSTVIAVRFELECPGFDPIPRPMPTLNSQYTMIDL